MSMQGYTYDDGSTISYDMANGSVESTQSPPGYLLTDYSRNFSPSGASAGATNWAQVLAQGFGRVIDYKTASLQAENRPPVYAPPPVYPGAGLQISSGTILLIGGAALLFILLSGGDGKKG